MIHIRKGAAPAMLRNNGKNKRTEHCAAYDAGQTKFTFDAKIYAAKAVKNALVKAQHRKCCFCESKVGNDGDVEHFRPKSASCQGKGKKMIFPGYYWLAYDWENLFLCCSACNSRHKRNYFPLRAPKQRALCHHDDLEKEDPLFINPATCNPEDFISFRQEIPYAINGNTYGKTTIEALKLDREIFNERRRDKLNELEILRKLVRFENEETTPSELQNLVQEAKNRLASALMDEAEFAGMARANFKDEY